MKMRWKIWPLVMSMLNKNSKSIDQQGPKRNKPFSENLHSKKEFQDILFIGAKMHLSALINEFIVGF
jgi:hypothetical protein